MPCKLQGKCFTHNKEILNCRHGKASVIYIYKQHLIMSQLSVSFRVETILDASTDTIQGI